MQTQVAVIDYGSQYSQLIVRRMRELGYFSKLYLPGDWDPLTDVDAVILSGGPRSVEEQSAPDVDLPWLEDLGIPVLGICYGMQLLNVKAGGRVEGGVTQEYGPARIQVQESDSLFEGVSEDLQVWMSHADTVTDLPPGSRVLATNEDGHPVALQWDNGFFGMQFHPEVSHTDQGTRMLANFVAQAGVRPQFDMESYRDQMIAEIRRQVGDREVLCAVSGGVDSTVLSVLLHEAGVPVHPVFIDTGLLRKKEPEEVQAQFNELGLEIDTIDARQTFLDAIEGVEDPEEKRRRIGDTFLDVFFDSVDDVEMLAQGTLYPDVIESATSDSDADTIKTHHNRVDRVLELDREGRVIEPLQELFKDEVRELGDLLGIPEDTLNRHPFPGPGMAIRVPGAVTPEKLSMARDADYIFVQTLKEWDWYDNVWQAFCVLLPVRTVGVMGDRRSYEYAVSVRSVVSEDGMTADWGHLPHELLEDVSNRILNQVDGINRVLYDISTKPPSSIEWE